MADASAGLKPWFFAALALIVVLLGTYHEGLLGTAAIDGASNLRLEDEIYGPYKPPPRGDLSPEFIHQPWDSFIMASFRNGELPLWQSACGFGSPVLGNGQSAPFNPLKLILWGGATGVAQAWFLVVRLAVAGLGTLVLARALGLSPWAGLLAAIAYMFNGNYIFWLQYPSVHATVYLPWILWAGERLLASPGPRAVAIWALVVGLTGVSGHPESAVIVGVAGVFVPLWRLVRESEARWRRLAALALALPLAAGVAAISVLPFLEVALASESYLFNRAGSQFAQTMYTLEALPHWRAVVHRLLTPDFHGFNDNAWVGTLALALVPVGFWNPATRRVAAPLLALGVGMLLVCPPGNLLPALPVSLNSLYLPPVLAMGLALAGAGGLDVLRTGSRTTAWIAALAAIGVALAASKVAWSIQFLEGGNVFDWWAPAAALAVVPLAFALRHSRPMMQRFALSGVLMVATAHAVTEARVGVGRQASFAYPTTPLMARMRETAEPFRAAGLGQILVGNTPLVLGLEGLSITEAFQAKRFAAYYRALHDRPFATGTVFRLQPGFRPDLLDIANVRYVLHGTSAPETLTVPAKYTKVASAGGVTLYANPTVMPRAYVAYQAAFAPDDVKTSPARLLALGAAVHRRVLIETADGQPPSGWKESALEPDAATVSGRTRSSVTVQATAREPGWLVLSETWYPGWSATLDGQPVPIYPANVGFRAVQVPAGSHTVAFKYAPFAVTLGLALTLLALLICFACFALDRPRPTPRPVW